MPPPDLGVTIKIKAMFFAMVDPAEPFISQFVFMFFMLFMVDKACSRASTEPR